MDFTETEEGKVLPALRGPGTIDYIDPELERLVAQEIRQYPNQDAPSWLAPVAAILCVERWLAGRSEPAAT